MKNNEGVKTMFKNIFTNLCNKNNVSPTAVCIAIGLSNAAYSNWDENSVPRKTTLLKIANYFNVSVEYLLGEEKEKPSDKPKALRVPVYGEIAAGIPIDAIEDIIDYEELPVSWTSKGKFIALKIKGDSMSPRICDEDIVIIRLQEDIENGEIAAIYIGSDCNATCKRVKKTADGISLISLNPAYPPMFFTYPEVRDLPIKILGKVVELRGKF